jgi:hypothetical protein
MRVAKPFSILVFFRTIQIEIRLGAVARIGAISRTKIQISSSPGKAATPLKELMTNYDHILGEGNGRPNFRRTALCVLLQESSANRALSERA